MSHDRSLMDAFLRLLRYATPAPGRHRRRGAGHGRLRRGVSAALAYLIKPIFDEVLPTQGDLRRHRRRRSSSSTSLKGIGAYFSGYLMDGRRPAGRARPAQPAVPPHPRPVGGVLRAPTTGQLLSRITNDVGQVQRAVSETIGDLRASRSRWSATSALLFYYDARLALCA